MITYLTNGDYTTLKTQVTSNIQGLVYFVGVFLLGFVLYLILWPFLCCCCCCTSCCPSKCCQQDENIAYTKCELMWPTVTLILALLLVLIASCYGSYYIT